MTNHTQRLRNAIYTLLALLALSLTMTGWYAHDLASRPPHHDMPFAVASYPGCSDKLGDSKRPLCASYSGPITRSGG